MPPPQHQRRRMILHPPPSSPGMHQSKPAQARGKNGVSKSEQLLPNAKQQEHPSNLSGIHSNQCPGSRRVFQAVENSIHGSNSHLSSSSSSSSSIATRKTALNCFCQTRTPKSAHVSHLPPSKQFCFMKENALSNSVSNKLNRVKKSQASKISNSSETTAGCDPVIESHSVSGDLLKQPVESEELQFTLMAATKNASFSAVDHLVAGNGNSENKLMDDEKLNSSSSNTKTPPLQASFSPEIQSTATMATTPACYSAGHLISGVTDKRKCRARGVLAVAQSGLTDNDISSDDSNNVGFEEDYDAGLENKLGVSMLPSPAEASMHWLLSPCRETDENDSENSASLHGLLGKHKTRLSPSSPLPDLDFSFDWCNFSNDKSDATNSGTGKSGRSTNSMLISTQGPRFRLSSGCLSVCAPLVSSSPNVTPYSRAVPPKEKEKHCYDIDRRNSPLSADTLGSENVMQTPNSDTSFKRPVRPSCSSLKDHKIHRHHHSELFSMAGDLRLSPESNVSIWDTSGSSIKFDHLSIPSDPMDLSRFQKILDDQYLWTSNSTFEDVSQSEIRISWREGLVGHIFGMDEFDSCRCLSDEEEDSNVNNQSLEINVDAGDVPTLTDGNESKEKLHYPLQCSYAESISTDGDGLAQSTDSDWKLCFKLDS